QRAWLGVVLGTASLAGCAGAPPPEPTLPATPGRATLGIAYTGSFADHQLSRFTHELATTGVVDVVVDDRYDTDTYGVEQEIVAAVVSGDLDLGLVGARAFADLGVHDFDPLVAPMLIDSLATERAVLASDLPDRMLDGLEPLGVTGLAVVGGPLRRPIAGGEALLEPADFEGIVFHSWRGQVSREAVTALGATSVDLAPPERNAGLEDGSIRGYENTLDYFTHALERRANTMTANLNLWPSVGVLIANPASLAGLEPVQREALVDAAEQTAVLALDTLLPEDDLAEEACRGGGRLVLASVAALADFERAFGPVRAALAAQPGIGEAIAEIERLKDGRAADAVPVPPDCRTG
ncbi:MAG: TRAP transporter substrate-binding protein DctP, partial [Propionicimonas sp.]|nr:TRAP transporter substrate-binding protein DctP [Propionicimonas sp.]